MNSITLEKSKKLFLNIKQYQITEKDKFLIVSNF